MSTPQVLNDLNVSPTEYPDPGTGKAIPIKVDGWNQVVRLIIAASASETNTIAAPTYPNQRLKLMATSVGSGGSRTVTVSGGLNQDADTTLVFDTQYDWAILESWPIVVTSGAMTYKWRITASEGVGGAAPPDGTFDSLSVSTADGLTVNSVIVPTTFRVNVSIPLASGCVDQTAFIADRACQLVAAYFISGAASGGSGNLQVTKDTSTNAAGAGTALLTNNTNAGFDVNATANTLQTGTLTGTGASLQFAAGDRAGLDFSGTVTSMVRTTVSLVFKAI